MGRAERRREMKKGEKMKKPPVYNYTPESLRGQGNSGERFTGG